MSNELDDNFSDDEMGFSDDSMSSDGHFKGQGGSIEIDKKHYAWGLFWDIPHATDSNEDGDVSKLSKRAITKQARESAKHSGSDLFLSTKTQYALGSSEHGHLRGMKTVATSLIDRWGDSFLAVFELDDGQFYLLAVKDDTIIPGSDIRTEYENEAKAFILEKIGYDSDEWNRIVAPASFGIPDTTEEDIVSIIRGSRSSARLRDATSKNFIKNIAIFLIVASLAYGSYWGYNTYIEHKQQEEDQARKLKAANLAQQAKIRAQELAKQETWAWDNRPIGQYALLECQSAMSNTSIVLPGYNFKYMTCLPDNGEVSVHFEESTFATYSTVVDTVNLITSMHPHIHRDDKNVTVIYDYSPIFAKHKYTKHNEFGNVELEWAWFDKMANFRNISKLVQTSLTKPPIEDNKPRRGAPSSKNQPHGIDHIVFKSLHFNINSVFEPENWLDMLNPMKAFVVNSVTVSVGKSNGVSNYEWIIDADAYEAIWQSNINNPSLPVKSISYAAVGSNNEKSHTMSERLSQSDNKKTINGTRDFVTSHLNDKNEYTINGLVGGAGVEYKNTAPSMVPRRSNNYVAPVPFNPNSMGPDREK